MSRMSKAAGFGLMMLAVIALLPVSGTQVGARAAGDDGVQEVIVTNFPGTQRIEGSVTVDGAVRQASFVSLEELEVPPVSRDDVQRLIDAGLLETEGFGAVVLSLTGGHKGRMKVAGNVGVILLPDVESVQRVFVDRGHMQYPLEVIAPAILDVPHFHSDQPRFVLGFPRYRVLLYNTTDTTVTVNLYAYLTG